MATETHDVVVVGGSTGHPVIATATGGGPALFHEDRPVERTPIATPTSTSTPGRLIAGTTSVRGIAYGAQTITARPGGTVEPSAHRVADDNPAETLPYDR